MKLIAFIRNNRGNAIVEFAFVLPLLLLLCFGITEFGRAWVTKSVLTSAAREGARLAAVTAPDVAAVQARVQAVCNTAKVTPSVITVTPPDPADPDRKVTVRVETNFVVLSAKILDFRGSVPMSSETTMRHEGL